MRMGRATTVPTENSTLEDSRSLLNERCYRENKISGSLVKLQLHRSGADKNQLEEWGYLLHHSRLSLQIFQTQIVRKVQGSHDQVPTLVIALLHLIKSLLRSQIASQTLNFTSLLPYPHLFQKQEH